MSRKGTSPVYLATCPSWCDQIHPKFLASEDNPMCEQLAASHLIDHETTLIEESNGLSIELIQTQWHTPIGAADEPPSMALLIDGNAAATGLSPETVRLWATALRLAADQAERASQWH